MWPISEMVDILGREYIADLNRRRIRQKISIRGVWPRDKSVDLKEHPFLGIGKGHLRELRFAPKEMIWNMSCWLYADKVAFISSRQEFFGLVIHSKDFVELQKAQFEVIWKKIKTDKTGAVKYRCLLDNCLGRKLLQKSVIKSPETYPGLN